MSHPENTLLAFTRAIEAGIEMIECDVNVSHDGHLVIIHDWSLQRTTDGCGKVEDFTLQELQRLDAGSWRHPQFAGARIPTVKEIINMAREAGIYLCLEIKGRETRQAIQIASQLVDLLVAEKALEWIALASYSHEALAHARQKQPDVWLAPERLPDNRPADPPVALRQAQNLRASVIQHNFSLVTPELVQTLHRHDVAIWAWPPTTREEIVTTIESGVDGVMGDDAGLIVALLDEHRVRRVLAPGAVSGENSPHGPE